MHSIRMGGQNLRWRRESCKDLSNKYAPSKAPSRLNRSPNSRRLNGKIFLALVHDFKKVDDETAVVVEWKGWLNWILC